MSSIFVVSDIHGDADALSKALEIFQEGEFGPLFLLGDSLYHGPRNPLPKGYDPSKVAKLLNPFAMRITAVRGNCDSEVDQMLLDFPIMGDSAQFKTPRWNYQLTHGHLGEQRVPLSQAPVIRLSGHTHIPLIEKDGMVIRFNPGSISLPKSGYPASYGVIQENHLSVRALDSGEPIHQMTLD